MGEIVRYYLLEISIRSYNFNKTNSRGNKGGSIRDGDFSTFWVQKIALKKSMKFTLFIVYSLLKSHAIV